jgi:hypothetical protein
MNVTLTYVLKIFIFFNSYLLHILTINGHHKVTYTNKLSNTHKSFKIWGCIKMLK